MPRQPIPKPSTDEALKKISEGIDDIINRKQSQLKLAELHDAVSSLLKSKEEKKLITVLRNLLQGQFKKWSFELSHIADDPLIMRFSSIYDDFQNYCNIIPKFYSLYDRRNERTEENETYMVISKLFYENILSDKKLILDTTTGILKDLLKARSGADIDLRKIHNLINMYYHFSVEAFHATKIFEDFFWHLADGTQKYYSEFFKSKFEGNSFTTYLQLASEQFAEEEKILKEIFKSEDTRKDSLNYILRDCLDALIISHEQDFESGDEPPISFALTDNNKKPLKWLVDTYKRFDNPLDGLYTSCASFIKRQMELLTENFTEEMKPADVTRNIGNLIELTENLSKPYKLIFGEDQKANEICEENIKQAWNNKKFKIVENFCIYIDSQIRSEFKNLSPEENEKFPGIVAEFYSRIEDKSEFNKMYEINLVRRFIKMGLKLNDIESPIINAIRRRKAPDFVQNFKEYVKKLQDSQELENQFKEEMQRNKESKDNKTNINFSPIILDQKLLLIDRVEALYLPPQLNEIHKEFSLFYQKKHPRTRLMLLQDVSSVESKFYVPRSSKSASMRVYTVVSDILCASIIEAVSKKPLTCQQLHELIGQKSQVQQYLQKLCKQNIGILKRNGTGSKIIDTDTFQLNPLFNSQSARVVIPPVQNEHKKDRSIAKEKTNEFKNSILKAASVRLLKMKGKLLQSQLESDVIQAAMQHFRPDIALIRKILNEMENEYFTKEEDADGNIYLVYQQ